MSNSIAIEGEFHRNCNIAVGHGKIGWMNDLEWNRCAVGRGLNERGGGDGGGNGRKAEDCYNREETDSFHNLYWLVGIRPAVGFRFKSSCRFLL